MRDAARITKSSLNKNAVRIRYKQGETFICAMFFKMQALS